LCKAKEDGRRRQTLRWEDSWKTDPGRVGLKNHEYVTLADERGAREDLTREARGGRRTFEVTHDRLKERRK